MEEDPGMELALDVDSDGLLQYLLLVTTDMKEAFQLFLEVFMIDGTYCINKLCMPLY